MINTLEKHTLGISSLLIKCRVLAVSALLAASFPSVSAKKKIVRVPNIVIILRQNVNFAAAS